jgi:hypothetical protein
MSTQKPAKASKSAKTAESEVIMEVTGNLVMEKLRARTARLAGRASDLEKLVSSLDKIAETQALIMMEIFPLSVFGEFKLMSGGTAMPVPSMAEITPICNSIVNDFNTLFVAAVEETVTNVEIDSFSALEEEVDALSFSSYLGTVFAHIERAGELSKMERRLKSESRSLDPNSIMVLRAIRAEVRKIWLRKALEIGEVMVGIEKTILSFSSKVLNSLFSRIASANDITVKRASTKVQKVINNADLAKAISKVVQEYLTPAVSKDYTE